MGELSSIAFSSSFHSSSLGFDFHNLEVFNADMFHQFNEMESSTPSAEAAGFSTGYLEDVLFEFNTKRRRLFLFAEHQNQDLMDHSVMKCWASDFMQDCCENFDSMSQITKWDTTSGANDQRKRSKRSLAKVVLCPFALVKPGGFEGNVTLNDINKRISMPPTRAVRHPVGEFATRPLVSPEGPGLSGKDVVAFTKIQTRGRGTITIIRTRN